MRTKKSILIFLTDVIPLVLVSIIGIFKLKIFLNTLGEETLGLYQLFSQIMIYVALVDGGLSNAVLYSLYKPNVDNKKRELYSILVGARKVFNIIGAIVFFIAFIVSFFISYLIKNPIFSNLYMSIAFLIFSLSNVFSYFCVPDQVLLEVKEKKYIVNLIIQIGQIVQGGVEIILLLTGFSFITVLIMHVIIKFVSTLIIYLMANKKYKNPYKNLKPNFCFLPQIKHLLVHKLNGLVGSNIDILIISKVLGLGQVAIYSIYNYISNMLNTIISKFAVSITAIVGNYMEEDKNKSYAIFDEFNNLMFFVAVVVCSSLLYAFNSFIGIWYEGQIATSFYIAISFSLLLFVNIIIQPVCTFVNSAGLFKQTKVCAITDTITNLILSLIFIKPLGISGVVFATFISMFIAQFLMKSRVVFKYVIKESYFKFVVKSFSFLIILLINFLIGNVIFKYINIENIFVWFIVFLLYFIFNLLITLFEFKILGATNFINRVNVFLKTKKSG